MAIRRRQIQPDQLLTLRSTGEELEVVSDEAFLSALVDVGRMVCFAGGAMSAIVHRAPTDLDGEMVTVGAVLEWKDRTDARAQPEPTATNGLVHSNVAVEPPGQIIFTPAPPPVPAMAGVGAASLPFQRDEEPQDGDPLEDRIVHGNTPDPVEPLKGKSDEGIEDGIVVDEDAVDESDIPENLR